MDIRVEVSGKNGTTKKIEIKRIPQGLELTTLERLFATDEPQTMEADSITAGTIDASAHAQAKAFRDGLAKKAYLRELAAEVERDLANARRSRMDVSPLHIDEEPSVSRRVQRIEREHRNLPSRIDKAIEEAALNMTRKFSKLWDEKSFVDSTSYTNKPF